MDQDDLKTINLIYEDKCCQVTVDAETYAEIMNDEDKLQRYAKQVFEFNSADKLTEESGETTEDKQDCFRWTHKSTLLLIEFRLNKECEFNRPVHKKKKIWSSIAHEMETFGYKVTGDMCDTKYRNLLATYKVNKKKKDQSGEQAVTWEYFGKFESVLGLKASSAPPAETVGSIDDMAAAENNIIQEGISEDTESLSSEPSTSELKNKKRKQKDICFNYYLKEKLKREETKEKKDEERWVEKKQLKEREISAIEALAQAIAGKHGK